MVLQTPNYKEIAKLFIVHYSLLRCLRLKIKVSCEGSIDTRMRNTLDKLSKIANSGDLYYFVKTESMKQRAETKLFKSNYKINVEII